ncbi:leucine rich repeat LRR-containing protein [Nitzschia inconspicua]|uniref:Leucine rich repeat LRR-containing protein n=1 Tax=Nitzschia inconspicua TaxID=303405 RepID=A0A9K3PH39_9STRA|nr:leucine rich repeat LRR-containing protein [Nitzschia inconspicua]
MINNDQMNDLQLEDVEDYSADYPPVGFPHASENMAPMASSDDNMKGHRSPKYRRAAFIALARNNKWSFAVLGVVVIVLIGVLAAAAGKGGTRTQTANAEDSLPGVPPTVYDVASVDQNVLTVLKSSIESVYDRHSMDKSVLQEDAGLTPQRKALAWMATDVNVNSEAHTEKLQRYVLAVLFYSTNMVANDHVETPRAWLNADRWMTTAHSCDWTGIVCNKDKVIVSIDLERNRLTGRLPLELEIIGTFLESLDFTSNAIAMSGSDFNVFRKLPALKTLLMDDNYLYHDQGLPQQMHHLTNLEKLRLSYNLFEGRLGVGENPVIGSMTKLTHLEIESNFLTGTMPTAIGNLDQLVYLYMRRNNMNFNLNFLKSGKMANLFAMWLDDNTITGTIPTEIGLCTGLASLSLTNATLTGPIPSEIGSLVELRRLWLYNNQLTGEIPTALSKLSHLEVVELHGNKLAGSMPGGVCSAIQGSDYEYKSLTSDCTEKVSCPSGCCTQCF